MPDSTAFQAIRDDLTDFLRRRLLGPGGARDLRNQVRLIDLSNPDREQPELVLGSPTGIYYTGILFPPARLAEPTDPPATDFGPAAEALPAPAETAPDDEDDAAAAQSGNLVEEEAAPEEPAANDHDTAAPDRNDELPAAPDDDEDLGAAETLRNFNQLYPRYAGLSCCLPLATPSVALEISGRRYAKLSETAKQRVGLLLPDADTNPHYGRLLDPAHPDHDPAAYPELLPYFGLTRHAGRVVLEVKALPDATAYKALDRSIQRLRRESEGLFSARRRAVADPAEPADSLLRQWDSLRYHPARSAADDVVFEALTQQLAYLQQVYYAYEALQTLAVPLRTHHDGFNSYYRATEVAIALPALPVAEWLALAKARHGRYEKCFVFDGDGRLLDPEPTRAAGQQLRLHALLRHDPRHHDNACFLKVQLENFAEPVLVDTDGPYPAYHDYTVTRSLFGTGLCLQAARFESYQRRQERTGPAAEEDETTRFLYRHNPPYAIGHGVAAQWQRIATPTQAPVTWVCTDYLPCRDTPDISPVKAHRLDDKADSRRLDQDEVLRFQWLADFDGALPKASDAEVLDGLRRFVRYYQHWLTGTRTTALADTAADRHGLVEQEMRRCQLDLDRMARNIELLATSAPALHAFRLANAAMFVQLWHAARVGKHTYETADAANPVLADKEVYQPAFYARESDRLRKDQPAAWRPFQLAFLLLNVDGFVRPPAGSSDALFAGVRPGDWHERNSLVDLVWFPTGGGKTEAYLGLIAFCAILRRLTQGAAGGGTAVLMRYTLRLLTLQQFQRATRLVLALEIVRSWPGQEARLGPEPFSIGLWVGAKFLPNRLTNNSDQGEKGLQELAQAIEATIGRLKADYRATADPEAREALRARARTDAGKIPLTACPCCGTDLFDLRTGYYGGPTDLNDNGFSCLDARCLFAAEHPAGRPMPVRLCDELLYDQPPTLLFGTVDKFAALAHKVGSAAASDSRRLFGHRTGRQPPQNPPELIIQDELHLLQGPLGSSVALFESVLDQLCRLPGPNGTQMRAKVISSTATTRNTALQVWALYDREVNVFPKSGVQADDSFFAVYAHDDQDRPVSKRRYLGVCPTGKTMMATQRHLLALLLAHRLGTEIDETLAAHDADKAQLIDAYYSVVAYFGSLREVGKTASQADTFLLNDYQRLLTELLLTAPRHYSYRYLKRTELTGRMSDNQVKTSLRQAEEPYSLTDRRQHRRLTPDLLLATNMISVGLDIGRLNVMLVNGMPKSMAEYIQASSRVAREHAGLVVTLHHPLRPRDVSHYEHFTSFHDRLYAYVEPLSITPFTGKALGRYLPTVLAALVRQREADFAASTSAGTLTPARKDALLAKITAYFDERRRSIAGHPDLNVRNLLGPDEYAYLAAEVDRLLHEWELQRDARLDNQPADLAFKKSSTYPKALYADLNATQPDGHQWRVNYSLREIEPQTALKIESE